MLHYVHSSLIYNSQKLERTQMPLNRNGYRKCGTFTKWSTTKLFKGMNLWNLFMDGSGRYHPEWGNSITKEHTWYAFIDKWILAQKLRTPKIQFAKHMKLKKKEYQRVDISFFLRMENKIPLDGASAIGAAAAHSQSHWPRFCSSHSPHPGSSVNDLPLYSFQLSRGEIKS